MPNPLPLKPPPHATASLGFLVGPSCPLGKRGKGNMSVPYSKGTQLTLGKGSHFLKKFISLIPAVSQQKVKTLCFRKEMPRCPQPGLGARTTSGQRLRGPPRACCVGAGIPEDSVGLEPGGTIRAGPCGTSGQFPRPAGVLVQSQALPSPPSTASV